MHTRKRNTLGNVFRANFHSHVPLNQPFTSMFAVPLDKHIPTDIIPSMANKPRHDIIHVSDLGYINHLGVVS